MLVAPKLFVNSGGAKTFKLALAVGPLPPSTDVMLLVTLFWGPTAEAVTFTTRAQEALAVSVAPDKETELPLGVAVGAMLQVFEATGVPVNVRFMGKVSVKPMPLNEVPALGLLILNVSVVAPLSGIL